MEPWHLLRLLRLLETVPIDYMVTGSIAAILYGKPRLTHDMDVVVVFPADRLAKFFQTFDTPAYYCPPQEVLAQEIARGDAGHFNLIDQETGFKIDMYPFAHDPLIAWGFQRRGLVELLPGESVWVAPPEYVILQKLRYYHEGQSAKHLEDIRGILDVSGETIEREMINDWAQKLGLSTSWTKVSRGGPST